MLVFWPEFPFQLFPPAKDVVIFEQTVEEAKKMLQKAAAKKQRIRQRNLNHRASGGFIFENAMNLDIGLQYYNSKRGERRRYQLGRD